MASYRVEFSKKAAKELRGIDSRYIPRVIEAVEVLADEPRPQGCKKLVGSEATYRMRVGDYRVIYEIKDETLFVLVVRVRHRQRAYD